MVVFVVGLSHDTVANRTGRSTCYYTSQIPMYRKARRISFSCPIQVHNLGSSLGPVDPACTQTESDITTLATAT